MEPSATKAINLSHIAEDTCKKVKKFKFWNSLHPRGNSPAYGKVY